MALIGTVPRRCVNLPPGSIRTFFSLLFKGQLAEGPQIDLFQREFAQWLGSKHVIGAAQGRSAFQLALEALDLPKGSEIIFPAFTFPVMPMVAKVLGYVPVFCPVDPETFNSGPEQIEPLINEKTGAVLATHLFGRACAIQEIAQLCRDKNILLLEDCAHAVGIRIDDQQVGTFGDIGIYSFAPGKNMPAFAGGAICTTNDEVAARATKIIEAAPALDPKTVRKGGIELLIMWFVTRPLVFGLSAYQALKLKLWMGKPLMDSKVGDPLLQKFAESDPKVGRMSNLTGATGLLQLRHIDRFNAGATANGTYLTEQLGEVPGIVIPPMGGDHIYVYYPLRIDPSKRDDLRKDLLRHGIDSKMTDMADCGLLQTFGGQSTQGADLPTESSILEICVYPAIARNKMTKIGKVIRKWAGVA